MQVSLGTTDNKLDTDRRRGKPADAQQEDDGAASVRQ